MNLFRMRMRFVVAVGAALAGCSLELSARPPEWLRPYMEGSTEAGNHHAVMLLRSGDVRYITEDRVRRVYRGAVRVLNDHGRARAFALHVLNPDVEKIVSAQAWVIAADGRKSETFSTGRFTDIPVPVGRHFWVRHRMISFSAADRIAAGGVLAWEFQIESKTGIADVHWSFESDLPVQRTVFEIAPPAGGRVDWYSPGSRVPAPVSGRAAGALRWECGAVPPPKGDRPEGFLPEPQIVFARAVSAEGEGRVRTWGDFAQLAAEVIEPRLAVSPEVKARADAIVAGKTTRWEKIRALSEWVQREITYLLVSLDKDYLAGYRPHSADEVLKNRYGDCKDKMALLIAMLRASGEDGVPVLVAAGNPVQVRREWPAAVFNHVLVGIPAGESAPPAWPVVDAGALGRLVLFDPTDPVTPLGFLPAGDQAGHGLVASRLATALIALPMSDAAANQYRCNIQAVLDEKGALAVRAEENVSGTPGVAIQGTRERLNREQTKRAIEARLREGSVSVQELKWVDAWDARNATAKLELDFRAERYARRVGSLLMLTPQVLFARARPTAWQTDQPGVVWFGATTAEKEVRITLPSGLVVEELPDNQVLETPHASGRLTYQRDGDAIVYRYELKNPGGLLDRPGYEEVRSLLHKLQEAERRPIVLRQVGGAGAPTR